MRDEIMFREKVAWHCQGTAWPKRQRDILANLKSTERDLLLSKCQRSQVPRNRHLFVQGTPHEANFLIVSGVVRTYYTAPSGKEITLAYWTSGDLVGGPSFFDDHASHVWSAQASEDVCALRIRGADLAEFMASSPPVARLVLDAMIFKLYWVSLMFQTMTTGSVEGRLAYLLLNLSEVFGEECPEGGTVIERHFRQEDLASMIGTTRQWVNRAISQLCRQGVLRTGKRRLWILDRGYLEKTIGA